MSSAGGGSPADQVTWLIMEQLRVMDEQLDMLRARLPEAQVRSDVGVEQDAGRPSPDPARVP